jgi:spermidine synthase
MNKNMYLGTFLIAFTTLALEVTLSRLLSAIAWYHLAFFAISTAMLGMTAGATLVYLKAEWFDQEKLNNNVAKACLGYALVIPFSLVIICLLPLQLGRSIMTLLALMIATIMCSLPFFFSGVAISAVLTSYQLPIGKLYASDLLGASLGCLFVLGGLEILDAPSLIILCGAIGIAAGISFAWRSPSFKYQRLSGGLFLAFIVVAGINSSTLYGIRPLVIKNRVEVAGFYLLEKWNSFSRVVVYPRTTKDTPYWGASPIAPKKKVALHEMNIDGAAGTGVSEFSSKEDIDYLRFDVTNIAYYLRPKGGAFIIGVGGGRDVQSALLFGHEKIVGVDVNPVFINLLQGDLREFAGIADREEVTLVTDEARSYLARTTDRYSIIQMSLIDTWAATGAGAFSLSENVLYTVEGWQVFLSRLADDGIFTVSRWYSPNNPGEMGRALSLAVAALLETGITNPSQHIAVITSGAICTILVNKQPFSKHDIDKLYKVSSELHYTPAIIPGVPPSNNALKNILSAHSRKGLTLVIKDEPLNYEPPTDENPYFFNMLRLNHLKTAFYSPEGISRGNLIATLTLIGLILSLGIVTIATIVVPLLVKVRSQKNICALPEFLWPGALYFSLIGAGFMLVEIALIQRLSVFLGHPVYALGILLFTIIASTGLGSFLSEHFPLTRSPWVFIYPVLTALTIITIRFILTILLSHMITSAMLIKIVVSVLVIFPLGILMGFFFPTGMRLVKSVTATETPWYWALNGIFSVLCSALAVFISIYFGISANFYIATLCYMTLPPCLYSIYRANQKIKSLKIPEKT